MFLSLLDCVPIWFTDDISKTCSHLNLTTRSKVKQTNMSKFMSHYLSGWNQGMASPTIPQFCLPAFLKLLWLTSTLASEICWSDENAEWLDKNFPLHLLQEAMHHGQLQIWVCIIWNLNEFSLWSSPDGKGKPLSPKLIRIPKLWDKDPIRTNFFVK